MSTPDPMSYQEMLRNVELAVAYLKRAYTIADQRAKNGPDKEYRAAVDERRVIWRALSTLGEQWACAEEYAPTQK